MSDDDATGHDGMLYADDGSVEPARMYHGVDEDCPVGIGRVRIDPDQYTTWRDADGRPCLRRGESVSVGASRAYGAKYNAIDWGN